MGALELEPILQKESGSYDVEIGDLMKLQSIIRKKNNIPKIKTSHNMEDVMMDILKMGTSAGRVLVRKPLLPSTKKLDKIKSGQSTLEKDLSIG